MIGNDVASILQYLEKLLDCHANRDNVLKDLKKSAGAESPEQVWFSLFITSFLVIGIPLYKICFWILRPF